MLTGLDHLVALVADIDVAASAYARLFGRRPCWRGERPAQGASCVRFALANTVFELLAPALPAPTAAAAPSGAGSPAAGAEASENPLRRELETRGEGLSRLAFRVADMEAAQEWAAANDLSPGPPRACLERDIESGAFREWVQADLSGSKTHGLGISLVQREQQDAGAPAAAPETPGADPAGTVHALDHVVVQSADVRAAKALYGEALGLRLALEREAPQWGGHILFFRSGLVTVEVVAPLAPSDETRPRASGPGAPDRAQDRFYGAAWRVDDAAAAHARLAAAEIPVSELRAGRKAGTRVFTVKGKTCGVPTLVIENRQP